MNEKIFHQHLESLSDDELAVFAKTNDAAMLLIMTKSMPLILHRISKLLCYGIERDDLIQESRIALISAVRSFSLKGGASFKTYSDVCIRNRLSSVLKAKFVSNDAASLDHLSIDVREFSLENVGPVSYNNAGLELNSNPEELFLSCEDINLTYSYAKKILSDFEFKVFVMYLGGYSYAQISEQCDSTVKSVDNAMQRIRRKLKAQTEK